MHMDDLIAVWVTLKLAVVTTLILLLIGTPLAWWLSRTKRSWKSLIEALVALPLILPPTVLGFYLLVMLGPNGPVGGLLEKLGGQHVVFSFAGLVIASVIYSLPFMVQPLMNGFNSLGERPLEAAAMLRASPLDAFFTVAVPMTRHAFISAMVLTFAHTIGEFGVVLMVGGNIPGVTRVLSLAIYDHVEAMDYTRAHFLAGGLLFTSFVMLVVLYTKKHRSRLVLP